MQGVTLDQLLDRQEWTVTRLCAEIAKTGPKVWPSTLARLRREGVPEEQQRDASLSLALAIEQATEGMVRAEEVPLSARTRSALARLRSPAPPSQQAGAA